MVGLATLLEGAGYLFDQKLQAKLFLCEKLENEVIIYIVVWIS